MTIRHPEKKYGGLCSHCGRELARSGMTRHLSSCAKRPRGNAKVLHVVVESTHWNDFWIHVMAPTSATLADLDAVLRETWLECCGHPSVFDIGGVRFESRPMAGGWGPPAKSMGARLSKALPPGTTFRYEYDYGSTTLLQGRCVRLVDDSIAVKRPSVVARNLAPPLMCDACGKTTASVLDTWGDAGALCTACLEQEVDAGDVEEEGVMPVVNSPRMGVCGYTG